MARICPTCGRESVADARFCAGCGAVLPTACAACGAELQADAAFCAACGAAPVAGGPQPPRKGQHPALIIGIVALVVLLTAAATLGFLFLIGGDDTDTDGGGTTVTQTPTAASTYLWPGGEPFLAVASGVKANHLATLNAEGAVNELATGVGSQIFQLAWSPNGSRLACIGGSWKRSQVWLYDGATGEANAVSLSSSIVAVDSIAWLSPGELLVAGFASTPKNTGENAEFLVYDPSSGTADPLADSGGVALRGVSVSASRDGAKVAFVTYTDQKKDQYGMASAKERLQVLDRDTGEVEELGTNEALFDVNARAFDEPLISPSGAAIIYRRAGSDVGTSYTVLDTNGVTLMPVKETQFPSGYAWDPAGEKVVFTSHSLTSNGSGSGPAIFYLFDTAVGGKAQVIAKYKDTMVQDLSWSPDGSMIAFADYDKDQYQTGNIFLMSPAGGDADFLVKGALSPAWAPGMTVATSPATSPAP